MLGFTAGAASTVSAAVAAEDVAETEVFLVVLVEAKVFVVVLVVVVVVGGRSGTPIRCREMTFRIVCSGRCGSHE